MGRHGWGGATAFPRIDAAATGCFDSVPSAACARDGTPLSMTRDFVTQPDQQGTFDVECFPTRLSRNDSVENGGAAGPWLRRPVAKCIRDASSRGWWKGEPNGARTIPATRRRRNRLRRGVAATPPSPPLAATTASFRLSFTHECGKAPTGRDILDANCRAPSELCPFGGLVPRPALVPRLAWAGLSPHLWCSLPWIGIKSRPDFRAIAVKITRAGDAIGEAIRFRGRTPPMPRAHRSSAVPRADDRASSRAGVRPRWTCPPRRCRSASRV